MVKLDKPDILVGNHGSPRNSLIGQWKVVVRVQPSAAEIDAVTGDDGYVLCRVVDRPSRRQVTVKNPPHEIDFR